MQPLVSLFSQNLICSHLLCSALRCSLPLRPPPPPLLSPLSSLPLQLTQQTWTAKHAQSSSAMAQFTSGCGSIRSSSPSPSGSRRWVHSPWGKYGLSSSILALTTSICDAAIKYGLSSSILALITPICRLGLSPLLLLDPADECIVHAEHMDCRPKRWP